MRLQNVYRFTKKGDILEPRNVNSHDNDGVEAQKTKNRVT